MQPLFALKSFISRFSWLSPCDLNLCYSCCWEKIASYIKYSITSFKLHCVTYSAAQEGIKEDPTELSQFIGFVKRNKLQSETFFIAHNECELCCCYFKIHTYVPFSFVSCLLLALIYSGIVLQIKFYLFCMVMDCFAFIMSPNYHTLYYLFITSMNSVSCK